MTKKKAGALRFLVTGASGFIGTALCRALCERGHCVIGIVRQGRPDSSAVDWRAVGEISAATDWAPHLEGIDRVIHLAGRAHRPSTRERGDEPAAAAALLRAAAKAGVGRLVQMSSIKVLGEKTPPGIPFRATDPPHPEDAYGRLKLASERALLEAAQESGSELVILRAPLVYGPGVKGNLRALLRLLATGLPLPFAGIHNKRSLIFLENLVDLAIASALHPAAKRGVFLLRDADFSTPELLRTLAEGLGRRAHLFPLPSSALSLARALPGLGGPLARLTLSLTVEDGDARAFLGWAPPFSAKAGLLATARAFAAER